MKIKFRVLILVLVVFSYRSLGQIATVKEYSQSFTTYPYSDPNPIPSFTKIYPYFRFDGFTDKPVQKEWKVVELGNEYIKVMILPEIGGKIWAAIEKSTNQPYIYYNHVVKFRDVAMRGPWTSGGIEANYGIIGHTPNCATPVDYTTRTNEDGSVSCIIGVLDLLTRTHWRIDINLPADKAFFTTKSFWYNSTSIEQPYYHWMNAGIRAKGNLEFIYPGTKYIGHEGEYAEWPVNKSNGKKISFYEQNNFGGYKSYHVFGEYAHFFGGYWHDDDFGMARYGMHDDKAGKKVWIWGLSQQGMIWEKLLTDTDGQYVEVQSGKLFNQNAERSAFTPFKHKSFAPHTSDEWIEYWYPVLRTKGFVEANEYGALNVQYENGWLKVYFSPVQKLAGALEVKAGDKIVYQKNISVSPLQVFSDSVQAKIDPQSLAVSIDVNKLVYQSKPGINALARPVEAPKDFDWNSVYGLYLQGKEAMDQKLYTEAEEKLTAALQKDRYFMPALVKMAELQYRNLRYTEALAFAKLALSIDTHDGAANYYYGLINNVLGNTVDAKDGFDLAALSPDYRGAAYTELSKLYLAAKDYNKVLLYTGKAIDVNRYNIPAYEMQAIVHRYLKNRGAADDGLKTILSIDPLNHFAGFEACLWESSEKNITQFISSVKNEQPYETFLELAISYFNRGCVDEAIGVLQHSPSTALTTYWLAFLQHKKGKDFAALLRKADQSSPAYVFPFRAETSEMLQWAATQTNDWKPVYWLALIYKDRNRLAESATLFRQLGEKPDYAPFYAARASLSNNADKEDIKTDLIKAIALNKTEWRYYKSLAEFYIQQHQYDEALAILANFYTSHPSNYIIGMLYAKALLLNKQYTQCDKVLSGLNIIPFEGATEGRQLYRETKLMLAIQQIRNKNFKKALSLITQAREWPEQLGAGKPYEEDVDERLENWMAYYCYSKMGNKKAAQASLQHVISFMPNRENTVSNFYAANGLVSLWALQKIKDNNAAVDWLKEQLDRYPGNKQLLWVKAIFENSKPALTEDEEDASMRLIEQMRTLRLNSK